MARTKARKNTFDTKQEVILDLFRKAGVKGLISSEVEKLSGIKHQTITSRIRSMELSGDICKTNVIRDKHRVYIHRIHAVRNNAPKIVPPTPIGSWRKKYNALSDEIEMLLLKYVDLYHDRGDVNYLLQMHSSIQSAIIRHKINNKI